MPACANCGEDNPARARFCLACGRELTAEAEPPREVRKTVTILFADLAGSTALGEGLDPETLRRVMDRYFDVMRRVVEAHGGTVEKFIGDAVMAVFGIPTLHEDDALRAVRAATEMREALRRLNENLERDHGVRLEMRTGIHTGEVVAGDPSGGQRLVTGDAVNVAARLEQVAGSGEILLGEATFRLVRDAVEAERVPPLELKGKTALAPAYRLRSVSSTSEGVARRLDSVMVGRERERTLLSQAFTRAASERACHLFTILGAAGVGKSRLVAEFVESVAAEATVLHARCLPYGEGITYWPLREIVTEAASIGDDDTPAAALGRIRELVGDNASGIADDVAALLGLAERAVQPEEGARAARLLFERLARRRPLVLVFDDIHWAENGFLDLIEHVADWSRDASILLLCVARPELLELRAGWGGGKMNSTSILLQPLSAAECRDLISNLLGGFGLDASTVRRIVDAAEGNPLFIEQMVAVLVDDGILARSNGGWSVVGDVADVPVPASIHALLAARLDRLASEERAVIESASVVGRIFYRSAVAELAPETMRTAVGSHLLSLVRKELIRPHAAELADDDTFRFIHMLVRDAAYESMPKQTRAELHQRFAEWLERASGEREREFEEIVAYHLEEAYRYRAELGTATAETDRLRVSASSKLFTAADRARLRNDATATTSFLGRAIALLNEDEVTADRLLDHAAALLDSGEVERARSVAGGALERARAEGDDALVAWARAFQAVVALSGDPGESYADTLEAIVEAIPLLERAGHRSRLLDAAILAGAHDFWLGHAGAAAEWFERALLEASALEDLSRADQARRWLCTAILFGPMPVSSAIPRLHALREEFGARASEESALAALGVVLASSGEVEEGRRLVERALQIMSDLGHAVYALGGHPLGALELNSGGYESIVERLAPAIELLAEMGHTSTATTTAGFVAEAHAALGNLDAAVEAAERARRWASEDDVSAQMQWRRAMAVVLVRRGDAASALRLASEAADLASGIDYLDQRALTFLVQSQAADAAGDTELARAAADLALEAAERRENVLLGSRIRAWLERLDGAD